MPEPSPRRVGWRAKNEIMGLTISDIQKDIMGYQQRIQTAEQQLANLPEGYLPYAEHKRREKVKRECQAEIDHVKGLIGYAIEGIKIRSPGRSPSPARQGKKPMV